ncbi:MAG: shikimate dehydrogenase [Deltaproteobacteria bacterium]|nr:shikimate dehydrogenase [Deltaproteobacteria bacterium]
MSRIDPTHRICALFGHPVGHSLSPAIHNAAFAALGIPLVYVAHDIAPGQIKEGIAAIRTLNYRGLSVTIPHKVCALSCMDEVDPTANAIGCINTVVNDNGRLRGYNSDGRGALNALREAGADPKGQRVLMLGSGGGARAISMTLALEARPQNLSILSIDDTELTKLTNDITQRSGLKVDGLTLNDHNLKYAINQSDILLHCTPVGQSPNQSQSLVPTSLLRNDLAVFDIVYNPRRTQLLQQAAAAGCRIIEGVEMFLGQALVQFELWTGKKPPVEVMRQVLLERL